MLPMPHSTPPHVSVSFRAGVRTTTLPAVCMRDGGTGSASPAFAATIHLSNHFLSLFCYGRVSDCVVVSCYAAGMTK